MDFFVKKNIQKGNCKTNFLMLLKKEKKNNSDNEH